MLRDCRMRLCHLLPVVGKGGNQNSTKARFFTLETIHRERERDRLRVVGAGDALSNHCIRYITYMSVTRYWLDVEGLE
jgi:hypothetical protein